jgi:hypothetical protein
MTLVKTKLKHKMDDDLLDDCLVTYIERDIFFKVYEDDVETFMSLWRRSKFLLCIFENISMMFQLFIGHVRLFLNLMF